MKTKTLDKQNIWMIANWEKLLRLEDALGKTRENYIKVFGEIHKAVKERHPSLNRLEINFSSNVIRNTGGEVAFSNTKWPSKYESWPTGIYIWGISLDELSGEKHIEPTIYIWVRTEKNRSDKRVEILRSCLGKNAKKIFEGKNLQWKSHDDDDSRVCLTYPQPEDQSKLIKLLVKDDSRGFIDCIANHVNNMAKFIPVMNEVLTK